MSSTDCYPDKAPKVGQLLDTLSTALQRELIHYFENFATADTASLDELVTHIDGRVPTETREIRTSLLHHHLPKLQDRGWIDYDARTEAIRYYGHDTAEKYLMEVAKVFAE